MGQIGNLGYVVLCILLVGALVVIVLTARSLKRNPDNGKVKLSSFSLTLLTCIPIAATFAFITYNRIDNDYKLLGIQQYGQRTQANVELIYQQRCRHSHCNMRVRYSYSPKTTSIKAGRRFVNDDYLGTDSPRDPHLVYAATTGTIPIAYDKRRPNISSINFDDSVFTGAMVRQNAESIEYLWIHLGYIAIFMMSLFWLCKFLQRTVFNV